ncbi:MAG: hypothetical protein K6G31_12105 [Paludibacteraceae bacterium]|nr:hypothetical protein [Paludibacteraceae bacterium]
MTRTVFQTEGCVCLSGGFTPGYGDTVFQTGGASVLSVHAFHILVMEVLPSRQQSGSSVVRGLHPRLLRYRLPDGLTLLTIPLWRGSVFWVDGLESSVSGTFWGLPRGMEDCDAKVSEIKY